MRKRVISAFVLACMMCLLLAGCQSSKSGATVAHESRNGVVRVLQWYNSYEIRFLDIHGNVRDDFGS